MNDVINKRYEVISKLGTGGMSVVYLARDKKTQQNVAIKVLQPNTFKNVIAKKRFENEIKLHIKVNSPYVVKVLDYFIPEDDNGEFCYLVMEYVEGRTLNDYISYRQNLTVNETVDFTKEILLGVTKLHELGIVHRDLKSSNIMISFEDKAKLFDLGIAQDYASESLTKTDNIIGSSEYVAPEISQGAKASIQSDYYALGILMYQMLTGAPPFSGTTPGQVLQKHMTLPIPDASKVVSSIPQALSNVVSKSLSKRPEERYQNFVEFYHDLKTCLSDKRLNEKPLQNSDTKKSFVWREFINSLSFKIIMVLLGVIVLAIAIILIVLFL